MGEKGSVLIPVLMYHGIADKPSEVPYGFLLQPTSHFELCMRYLHRRGFTTINLYELYNHLKFNTPLPHKPIVLTFDDGYLDNWVFVFPILKRFNMKGTIFINPDFVDPTSGCRPNSDDVHATSHGRTTLKWSGYLSWDEMRKMLESGLIDIQSHTLTHTWYFKSNKIVDFHHPNDKYYWLAWNHFPSRKHIWAEEYQREIVEYGLPIYEYGRSLGVRRYHEDTILNSVLVQFVKGQGGKSFFQKGEWKEVLWKLTQEYKMNNQDSGFYETDDEYRKRIESEIVYSKRIIEENLNKRIDFLCWAGGAYTREAYQLALDSGHLATTKGVRKNQFGNDPTMIHRIGAYLDNTRYNPYLLKGAFLPFFILQIESYRGSRTAGNILKMMRRKQFKDEIQKR